MNRLTTVTLLALISFSSVSCAQQGGPRGQKPPQEAFDVCADAAEGDTVTITSPEGDEVEATCKLMDDELVAVPDNMPPRH
ncbi:hypothetical protein [Alteromonas sp. C1M14]|uniref:hypothetical protein n=1 Tax=Alteromonas sp. C1M14 TaxID=2841567 RepID=UPI001C0A49E0|nr:hypothetical protein [Alteromonas sp. C1M14]MBU2976813.1 hypothetical protein [Alteromonas sp. C1M14]